MRRKSAPAMRPMLIALGLALTFALSGCSASRSGSSSTSGTQVSQVSQSIAQQFGLSVLFGESVSSEQANQFLDAFALLSTLDTPPAASSSEENDSFAKFYGNTTLASVLPYLQKRIHIIYPVSGAEPPPIPRFLAFNPSALLWFGAESVHAENKPIMLDGVQLVPKSPQAGVIRFNPAVLRKSSSVALLITLVQEARHSDCPDGVAKDKIRGADALSFKGASRVFQGESCGHFYVACPENHPEGPVFNCDARFWEAHTAGYLVARALAGRCPLCTTETRYLAALRALDSAGRILALPLDQRRMIWAWLRWVELYGTNSDVYWELKEFEDVFSEIDRALDNAAPPRLSNRNIVHE